MPVAQVASSADARGGVGVAMMILQLVPDLVAITVNERVSFPNKDPFLHNVFSQSRTRKFDLGSF